MTNENDDWEIAVDTGEFDKRLEKDRIAIQERADSSMIIPTNKPIRILQRPTSHETIKNSSQITNSSNSTHSSQTTNASTIKTYEQREQEYRQARLRIMGEEEESSIKDDENEPLPNNCISINTSDEISTTNFSSPSHNSIYITPVDTSSIYPTSSNPWYSYQQQYTYPPQ